MADSLQKLKEKRDKLKNILADIKTTGDNFNKIDSDLETVEKALESTIEHFSPGGAGSEAEGWKDAMQAKDDEIIMLNAEIKKCKEKITQNILSNTSNNKDLYQLIEEVENEVKAITKERDELKTKMGELDKAVDEIGGDIDKVGEETEKLKDKSEATKNKVADLAVKGFAVLGFFAGVYWTINGIKEWIARKKASNP